MTLVADFNSSVNVPFQRMRQMLLDGALQEGVVGANDFKVVQRGAGANQSVDVGTGFAWVGIDTGTRNGMGHVTNDATANVTVTASNATNPRVDQIILRWNDSSIPTGSGNVPTLEVLTGTAGAQITAPQTTATYRLGAAALPNDCLRLADILVPATSTSVTTANIVDRRPWARGARWSFNRTAGSFTGAAGFTLIDTNMQPRVECLGGEMQITCGLTWLAGVTARTLSVQVTMDGTVILRRDIQAPASSFATINLNEPYTPAAGSHVFVFQFNTTAAEGSVLATATQLVTASIQETARQNASNT
jgi:hypothetical protein